MGWSSQTDVVRGPPDVLANTMARLSGGDTYFHLQLEGQPEQADESEFFDDRYWAVKAHLMQQGACAMVEGPGGGHMSSSDPVSLLFGDYVDILTPRCREGNPRASEGLIAENRGDDCERTDYQLYADTAWHLSQVGISAPALFDAMQAELRQTTVTFCSPVAWFELSSEHLPEDCTLSDPELVAIAKRPLMAKACSGHYFIGDVPGVAKPRDGQKGRAAPQPHDPSKPPSLKELALIKRDAIDRAPMIRAALVDLSAREAQMTATQSAAHDGYDDYDDHYGRSRMCNNFVAGKHCRFGSRCRFSHSLYENDEYKLRAQLGQVRKAQLSLWDALDLCCDIMGRGGTVALAAEPSPIEKDVTMIKALLADGNAASQELQAVLKGFVREQAAKAAAAAPAPKYERVDPGALPRPSWRVQLHRLLADAKALGQHVLVIHNIG